MAIVNGHPKFYEEIFAIPDFFRDPVLVFGFQEINLPRPTRVDTGIWDLAGAACTKARSLCCSPHPVSLVHNKLQMIRRERRRLRVYKVNLPLSLSFQYDSLQELLVSERLCREVVTLDLFDPRASLRYDMNYPVPQAEHGRYATLIDIGSFEHLFDT